MKKTLTLICLLFVGFFAFAQEEEETVFGHGGIDFTGVWAGSVNSFFTFDSDFELSNGGFVMFEFNNDYLIGWSGYGSGTDLDDGTNVKIDGHDLIIGYAMKSNKSIHPVMYLKGGRGRLEFNDDDTDNITVVEPSIGVEANIFRWFRLGLEGGYRFVSSVDTPGYSDADFSSPVFGLRLKFGWSWD